MNLPVFWEFSKENNDLFYRGSFEFSEGLMGNHVIGDWQVQEVDRVITIYLKVYLNNYPDRDV